MYSCVDVKEEDVLKSALSSTTIINIFRFFLLARVSYHSNICIACHVHLCYHILYWSNIVNQVIDIHILNFRQHPMNG